MLPAPDPPGLRSFEEQGDLDFSIMRIDHQPASRARRSKAAFTLAEVMMASAILSVCAGAVMAAFATGFRTVALMRENQRATQILIEATEIIRLYSWDPLNTPGFVPATFTERYDPHGQKGVVYRGSVIVTNAPADLPASYQSKMRQVIVTLDWTTAGIPRHRELTTLIAKDGLQNYVY